jgi:serine/threonine-protein kinase RsbW
LEQLRRRVAADLAAETAAESATRWWDELQATADATLTEIALDDVLEQMLKAIQAVLGVEAVSVLVANEAGNVLVARGSVGLLEAALDRVRIPAGRGMAGRVIATRAPLVIDDLSAVELASPVLRERGMRSVAAVPILDDDCVLGVLHAASQQLGHFTDADVEVLVAVAARLAAAMKRVRVFESEREARARAELIAERIGRLQAVTVALSGDVDYDAVCDVISREVSPRLGGGLLSSTLWMRSGSVLRLARVEAAPETAMPFVELPLDAALPGPEAVRSGSAIWLTSRAQSDLRFPGLADTPTVARSFAVLPLKVKADVLGVLALGFDREGPLEPHEQAFFLAVTEQAAQAFDRARLRLLEARVTTNNAFLAQATAALAESLDYNVTLAKIVRLLVPELADLATIHLFDDAGRLRRVALAHRDTEIEGAIRAAGDDEHPAAFLAEIVRGRTLLIEDVALTMAGASSITDDVVNSLAPLHIHSVVLVPLEVAGQRVGVLSLAQLDGSRSFDPIVAGLAEEIAQRSAVAIENSRLHSELRKARRAETFLLEVATALARASGYEETLARLGGVAVPTLGDLCLIDVTDDDGRLSRMVVHHADPGRQALADELRRWPPDPAGRHPSANVILTGRSLWAPEVSEDFLRSTCRDDEHYEVTKALGITSYMAVPFGTAGAVLGSLTLVSSGSGRRFTADDLSLAEELGEQVAFVVDKARRYEREHRTSHILQASLLPASLPEIPGVTLSFRYLPGTRDVQVGGDFYDAVALPQHKLFLVIGDVAGHDATAAAMMGHLRSAIRTLAHQADGPADLTRLLRQSWEFLDIDRIATAIFCQFDIVSGQLSMVSVGHPPPLLVSDRGAVFVPVRPASPLGAKETEIKEWSGRLSAGEILLMYTDGVIEDRGSDLETQMLKLADLASRTPGNGEKLCDGVVAAMGLDRVDDVALLALSAVLRPGPDD